MAMCWRLWRTAVAVCAFARFAGAEAVGQGAAFGGGPCTLAFEFRVDAFPGADEKAWGEVSPMTLIRLEGATTNTPVLFVRILQRRVFVTLFDRQNAKAGLELTDERPLEEKVWHQFAVTDNGHEFNVYLDGRPFGYAWRETALPRFSRMQVGADGLHRRLLGAVQTNMLQFARCLSDAEVERVCAARFPDAPPSSAAASVPAARPEADTGIYRALRVEGDALHPLAGQLSVYADAAAWSDAAGRDLLVSGEGVFGSRVVLHRFLEMKNGRPVYDAGAPVASFAFSRFQSRPNAAGTFDLYANGVGTRFGKAQLVCYRNRGTPGHPEFAPPQRVLFDGRPLPVSSSKGSTGWVLADLDGDGTDDFVFARVHALGGDTKFPFEGSPWTGKAQRYGGAGRGYDIRGHWLGADTLHEVFWSKGERAADGALAFGKPRQLLTRESDYPLVWKTVGTLRALAVETIGGERVLLLGGNVDELVALGVENRAGDVVCGEARPLLRSGYALPNTYYPAQIRSVDLDGDGVRELLLDGNPGVVEVLKGTRIGGFESLGVAQMRGGDLAAETLVSPCRFDWDGDGVQDLFTGDASGRLLLWPGTRDAWTYRAPQALTVEGHPVKVEAGPTGSIQGPSERRWGYLKVAAGAWNGAPALVTDDITGTLTLYRSAGGSALQPGRLFSRQGQPFRAAWRCRPAFVPGETHFAGAPHDALLIQDWDGDVACAIPREAGGTDFGDIVKLAYADGAAIRLCGPAGLWGRGAIALADWDGDGRLDLVFGTNRSCQPFFSEDPKRGEATPFLLRNEGSNREPRFARPVPLKLKDGTVLRFGVHNATPWITDLDGDGRSDLLIGAENGKVYGFLRGAFAD